MFRHAIATGRAARDLFADLRDALSPAIGAHLAAVTKPEEVGALLRVLDGYDGSLVVAAALRLAPLVFVRTGELRSAEWAAMDLDKAEWAFTTSKTKTEHIVPLAPQAVAILHDLRPLTGSGRYVFPSARTNARPMSNNAVLAAGPSCRATPNDEGLGGLPGQAEGRREGASVQAGGRRVMRYPRSRLLSPTMRMGYLCLWPFSRISATRLGISLSVNNRASKS